MTNRNHLGHGEVSPDGDLLLARAASASAAIDGRSAGLDSEKMTWLLFLGSMAVALMLLVVGSPALALALLLLVLLWAMRESVFRWVTGISALMLALSFVPSRIYRLPVSLPFDLEPYRLVLLMLLMIWLVQSVAQRSYVTAKSYLWTGTAAFLLAVAASYIANVSRFTSGDEFAYVVKQLAFVISFPLTLFVITSTIRTAKDALKLVDLLIVCGGIAGILAVFERVTQFNLFYHLESFVPLLEHIQEPTTEMRGAIRVAGATAHPIAFSTMLAMLLGLGVARAFGAQSPRTRWVSAASCALMGLGVLLALSRTGVVGIAACGVVLMVGFPRRRRLLATAAFGLAGVVHMFFRGVIGTLIRAFTPSVISATEAGNDNGRLADYAWALPQLLNRPLFGLGLGTMNPARGARFIDNQYLMSFLDTGMLGLAAFAFLMWRAVSAPLSAGRRIGGEAGAILIGIAAASAVFAATSATFDTLGFPQVTYLFFALAGLGTILLNDRVEAEHPDAVAHVSAEGVPGR